MAEHRPGFGRTPSLSHRAARSLLWSGTAILLASSALAQDSTDSETDQPIRLSPVILQAGASVDDDANAIVARELWVGGKVATSILDTPASVSVITAKEIEVRNAQTVEEVLQYSAGTVTDYYGSDDRNDYYLVRGYQATTYRDGLTLGSMRGAREEPFAYERVELLRGANSTLFGMADPGGSVNFVTKTPRPERFGEVQLTYGSFDHKAAAVDFGDLLNPEGTLAYRFTAKVQKSDLEYDYSRDDETFLMAGLSWEITPDTKLNVVLDYLKRDGTPNSGGYPLDREYDRGDFFGEPDFNDHDVERKSITAMLSHDFGNGLSLQGNLRYSDLSDDFGYVYLTDTADRVGTVVNRTYYGQDSSGHELIGNAILKYDTSFGRFDSSTLAGLEFRDASTEEISYYPTVNGALPIDIADPVYTGAPEILDIYREDQRDYRAKSAFLTQNLSFDDRIVATVGLRHDWLDLSSKGRAYNYRSGEYDAFDDSDDFSETSWRGALTYKVTPEISTYVSYVESVAPPAIGVEPERGEQYEIGVKYEPAGTDALSSASVYDLKQQNITVAEVQGEDIIRRTVGKTRVRGFDIEGKAQLDDNLSLLASYSYMDSEVVNDPDYEGRQFASVPNHLASVWVNYTVPGSGARGDMTLSLGARYVGSYYFNGANTGGKSEAATLLDLAFSYQVQENTDLTLHVANLLDEQHVVGTGTADFYNPGRSVQATLIRRW